MGIFDFLKPKENESEIIKKLFPSLKGIHFKSISTIPKGDSFEKFFNSDIDGKWFFSLQNFAMIFKSFSDENYEKELNDLLNSNGLDPNSMSEESSHYYFQGADFKIEKPKSPGINLIIITNETVAHQEVVKLRSFDKLNEIEVKWIKGIDKIYVGEDALKRFNLSKDLKNTVLYFKKDNEEYLLIHIPTLNVAKIIINQIVKLNGVDNDFKKVSDESGWEYLHENNNMVVGYLPEHQAVRINHIGYEIEISSNKVKPKERKILTHEIMTKGVFSFELKNGDDIDVFGQRHTLFYLTEIWDEESEEWIEEEREELDEFHLTDYDKGYKFDESDLYDFFEIEEDNDPEWDFNGSSWNWCGIEDEDDYDTREKKWNTFKNKFPEISSKSHFEII